MFIDLKGKFTKQSAQRGARTHNPEIESLTEAIEPQSLRFYLSISISNISIYTQDQDLSISLCFVLLFF